MKKKQTKIITIDGPAGAGKTTVSKLLAARLGCVYVDTGSIYRGVAYEVCRCSTNWQNNRELETFLASIAFELRPQTEGGYRLFSSGQDITDYIRTPEITKLSSDLSAKTVVRNALLGFQRNIANNGDAVFEGRDMGTVVFPDADFKFFLTADLRTRALRRFNETNEKTELQNNSSVENKENKIDTKSLDDIEQAILLRDKNDSSRDIAPLKPAEDAIMLDSTNLTTEEVVEKIINHIYSEKL